MEVQRGVTGGKEKKRKHHTISVRLCLKRASLFANCAGIETRHRLGKSHVKSVGENERHLKWVNDLASKSA